MRRRDVVVIGASAGGLEALTTLVGNLSGSLPGTVLVVLHTAPTATGAVANILDRAGPLPARAAAHGDLLRPGEVLVAPPDHHLLVSDGAVALSHGPRENGHRPAVDALFRSASAALGPRLVSVVLSGVLDDGAAGSIAVRARGGVVLAQDPATALYGNMPQAAIDAAGADPVGLAELPARLTELVGQEIEVPVGPVSDLVREETGVAGMTDEALGSPDRPGVPSGFSCPDCHGALFEIEEGGLHRFRCRVGHAWSPASLTAEQDVALEDALWVALRALEEKAALALDLAEQARGKRHEITAERFASRAEEVQVAAAQIRRLLATALGREDLST